MTAFYRYIRPTRFDERRMDYITLPRGGVCLRFEPHDEGRHLFFTHARCHLDDVFSKDVARHIADQRAAVVKEEPRLLSIHGGLPLIKDTHLLTTHVISRCRDFNPHGHPTIISRYMQLEWRGLADALEELMHLRAVEEHKASLWEAAVKAMHNPYLYANAGR